MKILVIKPSSLGDVIHALPFLNAVKGTFPKAQIDWVISKNLKGILEDNPLISELIIFNKDAWTNIKKLPDTLSEMSGLKKKLRSKHYDMVVDLQGLLRSGIIAFFTRTTQKIGFAESREGSRYFYDKKVSVDKSLHAVDRCLEVAREIGADVSNAAFPLHINREAKNKIKRMLGDIQDYMVMVPSARWFTKRWPAENFADLIHNISTPCVIAGSKSDREIAQEIVKRARNPENQTPSEPQMKTEPRPIIIDLCGKTDLKELTALIAGAKAVVGNDSGPMHIAAALGVPTVAIFGPTDPFKTGPYGWQNNRKLKVIRAGVSCSPCRRKKCDKFICMDQVSVENVLEALKEYI